jgi:hypothetical protein
VSVVATNDMARKEARRKSVNEVDTCQSELSVAISRSDAPCLRRFDDAVAESSPFFISDGLGCKAEVGGYLKVRLVNNEFRM